MKVGFASSGSTCFESRSSTSCGHVSAQVLPRRAQQRVALAVLQHVEPVFSRIASTQGDRRHGGVKSIGALVADLVGDVGDQLLAARRDRS